ncbi:MAG: hypothetical protein IJF33_03800 [Clostridia bacterium]|nr:hypothetical protein [Clostridia bacterium]
MGLFSKLFCKDASDDIFGELLQNERRLSRSPNYQFSCCALRDLFLRTDFSTDEFYNNPDFARVLVSVALDVCKEMHIKIPSRYRSLPVSFVCNEDSSNYGYIIALHDARYECECNYIAMMIKKGQRIYYTNEFYADDASFSICAFLNDGRHISGIGTATTYDSFVREVLN